MPRTVDEYADDAAALEPGDFAKRHGRCFLLHHGSEGELRSGRRHWPTMKINAKGRVDPGRPAADFAVFPLRPMERVERKSVVVGRGLDCDVQIDDLSVSQYHAALSRDAEGVCSILDLRSKNGTTVDDAPVPSGQSGAPVPLESGCMICFGEVPLTFLSAAEFQKLVQKRSK